MDSPLAVLRDADRNDPVITLEALDAVRGLSIASWFRVPAGTHVSCVDLLNTSPWTENGTSEVLTDVNGCRFFRDGHGRKCLVYSCRDGGECDKLRRMLGALSMLPRSCVVERYRGGGAALELDGPNQLHIRIERPCVYVVRLPAAL
jgi:hypothetical protein